MEREPASPDAQPWELSDADAPEPEFVMRRRDQPASIVYSSDERVLHEFDTNFALAMIKSVVLQQLHSGYDGGAGDSVARKAGDV